MSSQRTRRDFQRICVVCGAGFIAKTSKTKYCSQRCAQTAYRNGATEREIRKNQKITDEQILTGIKEGLTRQEIADKYGVHVENLARRMKRLGVHARYVRQEAPAQRKNVKRNCKPSKSLVDRLQGYGFEFVSKDGQTIRIKCQSCGGIFDRDRSNLRKRKPRCPICAENRKVADERAKLVRTLAAVVLKKTPRICAFCGETFYSEYENKKFCSDKCKRKSRDERNGKTASIRKRCRKYGVYYDPSVKPKMIFERDHYRCMICGLFCNTDDDTWGSFGPYAPTVDHIIPLAKGGTHTFENCQCAHAMCNSYKRDLLTVKREEA